MVTAAAPLLDVRNIVVSFPAGRKGALRMRAVDDVSFVIPRGAVIGLVGESGCGKTTLGRTIARFQQSDCGSVLLDNVDLASLTGMQLRRQRRRIQMIFQNPFASLDPRMAVGNAIAEALPQGRKLSRAQRTDAIAAVLEQVGLDPATQGKFPHEFSGGQRQRIAIARALAAEPALIIADEPVSSLDVSVAAQVLNLLRDVRLRFDLSMLFISHDLSVVRYIADFLLIMYRGRVVECGPADELFAAPRHPYTIALLDAVPVIAEAETSVPFFEKATGISDAPPITGGCVFAHRCTLATDVCRSGQPVLQTITSNGSTRKCACFSVNPA